MEGGMSSSVRPSSEKNQEVRPGGPWISSVLVLVTEGIATRDKALQGLFLAVSCLLRGLRSWRVSVGFHAWAPHGSKAMDVRHTHASSRQCSQPSPPCEPTFGPYVCEHVGVCVWYLPTFFPSFIQNKCKRFLIYCYLNPAPPPALFWETHTQSPSSAPYPSPLPPAPRPLLCIYRWKYTLYFVSLCL